MIPSPSELVRLPAISHVFPDFLCSVTVPHVITGEHFDGDELEIWCWTPPATAESVRQAAYELGNGALWIPSCPPEDAVRIEPLDVERQVIVAQLTGDVLWVRTKVGWSLPYILNIARPFWISHTQAKPGELLHIYGFGLRKEQLGILNATKLYLVPEGLLLLIGEGGRFFAETILEGRSTQWVGDSRLLYFRVPADAPAGHYQVYHHNGRGGAFGWVQAGELDILTNIPPTVCKVNACDFGAKGDGYTDDLPALQAAMRSLAATGGTVFLPPGSYRIEETLCLLPGVQLRGAGRENTLILGSGFDPAAGPPAAVLALTDRTCIQALTVCGSVSRGVPSVIQPRTDMSADAMVRLLPAQPGGVVEQVSIIDCRLRALEETEDTREALYLKAIHVGHDHFGRCKNVTIHNNEIYGSLFFWRGERMEIVRNTWMDGTATINVTIHGWAIDSLLDSNIFRDAPGRICFYPLRHCLLRYNEVRGAFRGSWPNAEEVYLVHGSFEDYFGENYQRVTSTATGGSQSTLVDTTQQWTSDEHADAVVIITAGTGFGQYRRVIGNTADTLTIDCPWRVEPDAGSEYVVGWMYLENAFHANVNQTPMRMSLWQDCIANIIERHRDEFSKGIDIWGCDYSYNDKNEGSQLANQFHPSWYNMIVNGWLDGAWAQFYCHVRPDNLHQGPPMFANYFSQNQVRQPHMHRTGFSGHTLALGGLQVGNQERHQHELPSIALGYRIPSSAEISFPLPTVASISGKPRTKPLCWRHYFRRLTHQSSMKELTPSYMIIGC